MAFRATLPATCLFLLAAVVGCGSSNDHPAAAPGDCTENCTGSVGGGSGGGSDSGTADVAQSDGSTGTIPGVVRVSDDTYFQSATNYQPIANVVGAAPDGTAISTQSALGGAFALPGAGSGDQSIGIDDPKSGATLFPTLNLIHYDVGDTTPFALVGVESVSFNATYSSVFTTLPPISGAVGHILMYFTTQGGSVPLAGVSITNAAGAQGVAYDQGTVFLTAPTAHATQTHGVVLLAAISASTAFPPGARTSVTFTAPSDGGTATQSVSDIPVVPGYVTRVYVDLP